MQYRKDKYGNDISILGYGCMRFTTKGGGIDLDKAEAEIMEAYRAGVNYFDTAYIYPGSEAALGAIVEKNGIREKINIATKLPQYLISNIKAVDRYFNEELSRLRTTYVDYYLMHHLTDMVQWEKLKSLGIEDWISEQKKIGRIKNIGFSFHGDTQMFQKILSDYDWDFCLIQYNYLDETVQAGVDGLKAAEARGIPVIIMEPLRGGKLVNFLPQEAKDLMAQNGRGWSAAEWSFRWLWNQSAVTCVLSGMNSLEMVQENCRTASDARAGDFTPEDFNLITQVKKAINANEKVGCTSCRYCMPCPKNVDIPAIFRYYNAMAVDGKGKARKEFAQMVGLRKQSAFASQCVGCGKCEMHCPQNIHIREELKKADKALRPLPYKIGTAVLRKFMLN
ncbi:MAG: aldo/keto reductase [Treponema sp.]|nr:aldo/keto reductase [Treponema sp.]